MCFYLRVTEELKVFDLLEFLDALGAGHGPE